VRLHRWTLSIPLAIANAGCGTWLSVRGVSDAERHPGGIAVNERAIYLVKARYDAQELPAHPLVTIDPRRVSVVNWTRMPFSSGDLTMKLSEEQTLKEVSVDGTTGAARAAEAGSALLDALSEIEKAGETE
jgi:hypothetical protein